MSRDAHINILGVIKPPKNYLPNGWLIVPAILSINHEVPEAINLILAPEDIQQLKVGLEKPTEIKNG